MYSVLLIDDESWVMEALKLLVDWEKYGFEIVSEANNAEDARAKIEQHNPDLVISDIRMPGLSGIQLLEEYADSEKKFKTVFVTAYGKFEYAKKALELGASGYLLKPAEPEELTKILVKIKDVLDEEKGVNNEIYRYEKTKILYSLLEGYNSDAEIKKKLQNLGIENIDKRYIIILMKSKDVSVCAKFDLSHWESVILPLSHSRCLIFLQSRNGNMNLVGYKNLLDYLQKDAEAYGAQFGVSRVVLGARKFRNAFIQAEIALDTSFINKESVNSYRDGSDKIKDVENYITSTKNSTSIKELLIKLPNVLKENRINTKNFEQILAYLIPQIGVEEVETDSKEIISQFPSIEAYFEYLYQCVNGSYKKGSGKPSSRYIIKEITDYIKYNYNEKLMINDLAQKFFLNQSYLSGLFKEETGKPFTSYLVECRLKKAVELLETTDLSSSEISARVGYEDYFHFSKLFKKHIGMSPANYRKSLKEKKD